MGLGWPVTFRMGFRGEHLECRQSFASWELGCGFIQVDKMPAQSGTRTLIFPTDPRDAHHYATLTR